MTFSSIKELLVQSASIQSVRIHRARFTSDGFDAGHLMIAKPKCYSITNGMELRKGNGRWICIVIIIFFPFRNSLSGGGFPAEFD